MSLADDIYGALYDMAMAALNPGWSLSTDPDYAETPWTNGVLFQALPPVPVLMDQQAEASPVLTTYVTIQGTPSLTPSGTVERGEQDDDGVRNIDHTYTGEVVLWEVYGNGSQLQAFFEYLDTEAAKAIMDSSGVSILDIGTINDLSTTIDKRWIPQARATVSVAAKSRSTETLSIVQTVEWANAENPAFGGSVEYPIP